MKPHLKQVLQVLSPRVEDSIAALDALYLKDPKHFVEEFTAQAQELESDG